MQLLDRCHVVLIVVFLNCFINTLFSVLKYRETVDGIGKKVQKLNWHSVAKKTNRINQRITQFTGLNTQVLKRSYSSRI